MNHRFLAAAHPPADLHAPALVVHVGATTVAVADGEAGESAHFVGVLDGRPVWAVDAEPTDGGVPLMGLWGAVDEVVWTVAGRAVQLVEWDRTHRYCGRCGSTTAPPRCRRAGRGAAPPAGCSPSPGWHRR